MSGLLSSPDIGKPIFWATICVRGLHPIRRSAVALEPRAIGEPPLTSIKPGEGLELTVASLVRSGKRVVILSSSPTSPAFEPRAMVHRVRSPAIISPKSIDRADFHRFIAPVEARLSLIAGRTGAVLVRPLDYLCRETDCPATNERGWPLYRDENHLTASAAASRAGFIDSTLQVF